MIYYGRECQIYGNQDADVYIFCFFHDCTSIVESLKGNYCLIAPVIKDWNSELSPWPADGFGGKGEELEKWILSTMNSSHHYIIAGYSLGGLFSLWMYGRHESFVGCISASGSLWFPGWINYLHTINRKAVVYLSLGRKESKTKNKLMCTVGQNTIETYQYLSKNNRCIYIEENGGHFTEPDQRMIRGFKWVFENLSIFFFKTMLEYTRSQRHFKKICD